MVVKIAMVAALVVAPIVAGSGMAVAEAAPIHSAPAAPGKPDSSLTSGEVLGVDQAVRSPNGRYTFVQQHDGNLVLYNPQRKAVWNSNTARSAGAQAVMQPDGNFVIYDRAHKPAFNTNTANHPGARLDVQNDGNVVIYQGGTVLWSTSTTGK